MDLLCALPPDLYRCIVSFLSPTFALSRLSRLCHELSTRLTAACFVCGHLTIDDAALAGIVLSSSQRSLDLLSSVSSLSVLYGDASDESDVRRFFELRCPRRPHLFAFSSVTSLYMTYCSSWDFINVAPPLEHLLRLLQSAPQSFSSLARLHIPTVPDYTDDALSFQPLSCLAGLTHLRLDGLSLTAPLLSSLLSSLSSLPQLRAVDLSGSQSGAEDDVIAVWSSACITRRLQTLLMPKLSGAADAVSGRMDAFASSLTSSSRPSSLRYLLPSGSFSACGLLCLLSLPSLSFLDLTSCRISTEEFAQFCSAMPQAAAGGARLRGFVSPHLDFSQGEPAAAELYSSSLPRFLSSQRCLRHAGARSAAAVVQPSIASLQQLRRLELEGEATMSALVIDGPVSLPHLTSLRLGSLLLSDAALDALLAACAALLSLELYRCGLQSWSLLERAAQRCPSIISIRIRAALARPAMAAAAPPLPVSASPCFRQLVSLFLQETSGRGQAETDSAVRRCVRLLTSPPCVSLQHLSLSCQSISSQQILALASLPALRLLDCAMLRTEQETAWRAWEQVKRKLYQGAEAAAEDGATRGAARRRSRREEEDSTEGRERCEERLLPLHDQTAEDVKQQALDTAQRWSAGSSIFTLHGVEPQIVKQQLCQRLRAMLSERRER